jgi:Protein of unknown function (DUF1572)
MINENYLASCRQQFLFYKQLGEKAMAQLGDDDLFARPDEESNSIATIVQHMAGNMLSRWTDFLTTDGEKEWRNRDEEFEVVLTHKQAVTEKWEQGWSCLFHALDHLTAEQLQDVVFIRNEGHTVVEAINRQLAHYPYHVGQIVFLAKQWSGSNFKSLSIPKNESQHFNRQKFNSAK